MIGVEVVAHVMGVYLATSLKSSGGLKTDSSTAAADAISRDRIANDVFCLTLNGSSAAEAARWLLG